MAKDKIKTNALRVLDKAKIKYSYETYEVINNQSVPAVDESLASRVFKTLLVRGKSNQVYVCVIPLGKELDLKKVSAVTKEKKIEMLPLTELLPTTGYVRGGCSPIGMKKLFPTFIASEALDAEIMLVSGGKVGLRLLITPTDLISLIHGTVADLTMPQKS